MSGEKQVKKEGVRRRKVQSKKGVKRGQRVLHDKEVVRGRRGNKNIKLEKKKKKNDRDARG